MPSRRYEIAKLFSQGFAASFVEGFDDSRSEHWIAGYGAGCEVRPIKHKFLNEHLEKMGEEPMGIVRVVDSTKSVQDVAVENNG